MTGSTYAVVLLGLDVERPGGPAAVLRRSGYHVTTAQLEPEALHADTPADALVVDLSGLPRPACVDTRHTGSLPLLVVGRRGREEPEEQELLLRVAVHCRLGRRIQDGLRALGLTVSRDGRTVASDSGATAVLTPVEFELLRGILLGAGDVVPRDRLVRRAWRGRRVAHATLDSHIRGVRAKLRAAGIPLHIRTQRGSGYAWVLPDLLPA